MIAKARHRNMRSAAVGRRAALRGLLFGGGTAVIGLPLLEAMLNDSGTALADGAAIPRRLGIFFWGNGVHPARWVPSTVGAGWTPSEQLAPLAAVKDHVTVISGMKNFTAGVDGHEGGAGLLTGHGAKLISADPKNIAPTFESFDQLAARTIGMGTKFQSLQLRISRAVVQQGILYGYTSWRSATSPIEPERDPIKLFDRIFTGFSPPTAMPSPPVVDPKARFRRSVLDTVADDLTALRGAVGLADQARLDEHLTHIRAIEMRLAAVGVSPPTPPAAACAPPARPSAPADKNGAGQELLAPRMKVMSDLVAMALACDLTRVFALQLTGSVALTVYPIDGFNQDQHQLTHDEPGNQPLVHKSILQNMEHFGTLIATLNGVPEAGGTLLDNCAVFGTSDCSEGRSHSQDNYPMLLGGTAGGRLRKGVHVRAPGENTNKVMFSILNAVGCGVTELGEQSDRRNARVTSGLGAIEV